MGALQYIATSALSLTLSGNTGVGPFLTLFTIGVIEKADPTLLHMEGWVETLLASWAGLSIFGALTILEFVGKCVPVVDAAIDSVMVFVVPVLSVVGSFASFGLFTASDDSDSGRRSMAEEDSITHGLLIFLQFILVSLGVILAILVHLFKLLLRLMGEGCCTCCITVVEYTWIIITCTLCVLIVPVSIIAAAMLIIAGGLGLKNFVQERQKKRDAENNEDSNNSSLPNNEEQQKGSRVDEEEQVNLSEQPPSVNPDYVVPKANVIPS